MYEKMEENFLIIGIISVIIIGMFYYLLAGIQEIKEMEVTDIDLTQVKDGEYVGEFKGNRWSNSVEVLVEGHKITDIKVIQDVRIPLTEVTQKLFENVKENQSLNIDTISQTTINTKAYLKSIENALKKGME
ncbi:MAG: FMN-binding protein [Candidatus Atribacteria bacterium]|nr:FMN-binding protein [Candidatus Atribacteria bacterium]